MTETEIIRKLWNYGHFNNPAFPLTFNVTETTLGILKLSDTVVKQAVSSYQNFMGHQLDEFTMSEYMRPSIADGDVGPATIKLLEVERCGLPDYTRDADFALGTGSWKSCHGVGNFHCMSAHVDESGLPSFLRPVWAQVKSNVSAAYAELGLRIVWDDPKLPANTKISFVNHSTGWIGLAIVGRGQSCSSSIWAQFLATYKGGSSPEAITQQWTTLVKHELGHNCGLSHSRGGVMNPSIVNGLPISWKGDVSYNLLKQWFGGVPVDSPAPPKPPGTPTPRTRVTAGGVIEFTVPEGTLPGTYPFVLSPKPEF